MNDIYKIFKYIFFLSNITFIISTETLRYYFLQDISDYVNRLSIKLASINILCVKLFQAIALENNLIDNITNNKLIQFTDNVPWNHSDLDLCKLNEMVNKYDIQLSNEIPINSGMISLVFKCKQQNKEMIIKMKRKNIHEKLDDAIDNLLFSVYLLSIIPIINKYKIFEIINRCIHKNIEMIRNQTDFLKEIENMDRIRETCKNLKYVNIPSANIDITKEYNDIIVMNFIEGVHINKINKEDNEFFAKLVIKFAIVTCLINGISHGDLHSGNILFIKDINDVKYPYKIGIIDFGIIYEFDNMYKNLLFDIITNIFYKTPKELALILINSCIYDQNIIQNISKDDYNYILSFLESSLDEVIHSKNKINIFRLTIKINDFLSSEAITKNGIKLNDNIIKSHTVLLMSIGVILNICEDYITLTDNAINELFHTKYLL
jgi:predicted unusual protein kinase regulating ubiquinone biosynthesis (AarF/ABC1/UbiB family)